MQTTNVFLIQKLKRTPDVASLKILDYGCGKGELVRLLRDEGFQAFGADVDGFWEVPFREFTDTDLFDKHIIRTIQPDGACGFEDNSFDVIISNMVIEHVADKNLLFKRMHQLAKPNATIFLFYAVPDCIRESHIKQYFIHWFPKGKIRYFAALLQRKVGISKRYLPRLGAGEYVRIHLEGIDQNCHYEPSWVIRRKLRTYFHLHSIEAEFLLMRLIDKKMGFLAGITRNALLKPIIERIFRFYSFAACRCNPKEIPS